MSVAPYWELTFDAEGDVHPGQLRRLRTEAANAGITELVVFSHGWNNDRSIASRLYSRFFAPMPKLAEGVRLGYVGVLWPSMRFTDEPIPDFERGVLAPAGPRLDATMRRLIGAQFPGRDRTVDRIALLLEEQPEDPERMAEFARLVRHLTSPRPDSAAAAFAADMADEPEGNPLMLEEDAPGVFEEFAAALTEAGQEPPSLWGGGRELLRQATYYAMKRRAGTVGERGLGPALGRLAEDCPELRVHLVGHSFGARLVSFALRGLPAGVDRVASVVLLQGAFSHYAFAEKLPHDKTSPGALRGVHKRIAGPLISCHSKHDGALRVLYPLASRMARDAASLLPGSERWGAIGFDGIQAVTGAKRLSLKEALSGELPTRGYVSVDAAAVVRRGGGPAGAHSDICHKELAQVVLSAGRVGVSGGAGR